jgi:hypothetical protein
MFTVGLQCDGCGEEATRFLMLPDNRWREVREWCEIIAGMKGAGMKGWEHVRAPDGEQWYCPTCRRARDGETLMEVGEGRRGRSGEEPYGGRHEDQRRTQEPEE